MSYSYTRTQDYTQAFTLDDARELGSVIKIGLTYIRLFGGMLEEQHLQNLVTEATILLKFGLLDEVEYGYKKNGYCVYALRFKVNIWGQIEAVTRPPSIINPLPDLKGAGWYSLLTRRHTNLTPATIAAVNKLLPIQRGSGSSPSYDRGRWVSGDNQSRNGVELTQSEFRPY